MDGMEGILLVPPDPRQILGRALWKVRKPDLLVPYPLGPLVSVWYLLGCPSLLKSGS